jgi:hypothetical protein
MASQVDKYLWLTRWPPYAPRRGGDIDYSRNLMQSLALCAPVRGLAFGASTDKIPAAPGLTWSLVDQKEPRWASVFSPLPNVAFRHQGPAYLAAAIEAARGVEAVFVDFIGLFDLVEPLRRALDDMGAKRPLIVVVNHNFEHGVRRQMVLAETKPMMRAALAYDTWKSGMLERRANRLADALIPNTVADQALFATVTDKPSVVITPAYEGARAAPRTIDAGTPARICVLGNHDAHHKRMVLERTLAALAAKGIEKRCIVDVVGGGETESFAARYPGFHFYGYVDSLDDYLKTVRFGLIPDDIGGGFKHRALTHAFMRVPMLALNSALNGMGFTAGLHYAPAETLADLADAIPALLDDFPRLNALQTQAFDHCESAYDWADRGRALHAFVSQLPRPPA